MLAQHFHHKAAFSFVWTILDVYITAVNPRLTPTSIIRAASEDRLQCAVVELACEAVARTSWAVAIEGVVDEEGPRIKREGSICCLGQVKCCECKLARS